MASNGEDGMARSAIMLVAAMNKRKQFQDELQSIERQIYELETGYLQDSNHCGSVLKGFEGYMSSTKSAINMKRSRKFQLDDRLFSLSSVTSPATAEQRLAARDDGRSDYGPGRPRNGLYAAIGLVKPKKGGRILPREGRRLRPLPEQEIDDEDDNDQF
ncbi:hypothetical protein HPP92_008311 [Vanilla planifolia]|uniref:Chromatin modification-related protein MEAF6 n=1 Tax=Vanilla planifolia TaxID=51239 RepID=A0A835RDF4_VANPL|nr:hypothetical protein HPP92_008311 [Vanilla planifolia]